MSARYGGGMKQTPVFSGATEGGNGGFFVGSSGGSGVYAAGGTGGTFVAGANGNGVYGEGGNGGYFVANASGNGVYGESSGCPSAGV
jgi:hypothetical protein